MIDNKIFLFFAQLILQVIYLHRGRVFYEHDEPHGGQNIQTSRHDMGNE